ncbi:MAG: glycosyltransferase family 2 protein [Anaerolineae bacterium]|nr:glycosyltransferase family 2 protein [Anaerolineae bacterium]
MTQPDVSIIVLNYNSREDTLDCLRSLQHLTYLAAHVIVVDNGSSDGTPEAVREAYPRVTVLETGQNLGFTGGNNIGIQHALEQGADYIMLLNNDTIVAPDMIDVLVGALESDPSLGVVGPTIYYYDQPEIIWSAGGSIDWVHGTTHMLGIDEDDKGQFGPEPRTVDFVTGCALLARRQIWEQVGLLDDRFFMYFEETEWCVRATRAGFRIAHIPAAMMWHKISVEARAASPRTYYYMTRNRLLFLRDTHASLKTWILTLAEYARTFVSWSVRPKWQDRRHLRSMMLRAIKDYSTGKFGPLMA